MRFPELDFTQYAGVTVTSATVSLRDLMCEETEMTVYCYPFTGTAWTESTASWSALTIQSWGEELDSQVISYNNGLTQDSSHRYEFDISDAVQAWIDGTADSAKGIIFKAHEDVETATTQLSKIFGSFEQDGYKPIFEMTYTLDMTLNYSSKDVDEGGDFTLVASTSEGELENVTWISQNTDIATVSPDGKVIGIKAGTTTIKATSPDANEPAYCTVYVTVPDGVYRIKSLYSTHYMGIHAPDSTTSSYVEQQSIQTEGMAYLGQLWMIEHISNGNYRISPMSRVSIYLWLLDENVYTNFMTSLELKEIQNLQHQIAIHYNKTGYILQDSETLTVALCPSGVSQDTELIADNYHSSQLRFRWSLELVTGVFVYNSVHKGIASGTTMYLELGETKVLGATVVSGTGNLDDSCTWYTNTDEINPVNMYTGLVTGQQRAATVVPVGKLINETRYLVEINLICRETIYVKNYYDSTVDSTLLDQIDDAVDFLNKVYNEDFFLYFEMDGLPVRYDNAPVDVCPLSNNAHCHELATDGECSGDPLEHHKNTCRFGLELYNNEWERNHIVVMWSNCTDSIYCETYTTVNDGVETLNHDILDDVYGIVTTRKENDVRIPLPVVQILCINQQPSYEGQLGEPIVVMSVVLAHEIAHTLGLKEVNSEGYDEIDETQSVAHNGDSMNCVMATMVNPSMALRLCDFCKAQLELAIPADAYEN